MDLLPIAEFAANQSPSATTGMSPFFLNKGYDPRMSFSAPRQLPGSTRQRIQFGKASSIAISMEDILHKARLAMSLSQKRATEQTDKSRKLCEYTAGDLVWLSTRHVNTERPSKKLDDKMIGPFKVLSQHGVSYRLELPSSMKIHDVFHASLLRRAPAQPLPGQLAEPQGPVVVDNNDEWEVDDILDSRYFGRNKRLQYRAKWTGHEPDATWYEAKDFQNATDVVRDYHLRYPGKPAPRSTQ